jgi:hypothetical protein
MRWSKDISERALSTFLQGFAGALPVTFILTGQSGDDLGSLAALGLAGVNGGIAALLSVAKNVTAEGAVVEAQRRCEVTGEVAVDAS